MSAAHAALMIGGRQTITVLKKYTDALDALAPEADGGRGSRLGGEKSLAGKPFYV